MLSLTALFPLLLAPQQPSVESLQHELARLVDLPTATARQRAAEELAQKNLATVEQWTAACQAFGVFEPKEPGPTRQKVLLQVLDQVEAVEVFLYIPQGYDPKQPAPLLLWGHGAGGSGAREYLHWQDVADRIGMLVLAPTEFGKEPGWGFTPRERAGQLAALRWARRQVNVDENAVFVGGWSRGSHMAWDLMLRHPDGFAGALPCVGAPRMQLGPQNNLRFLENVVQLPIRSLQGSQDEAAVLTNLHLAFARLQKFGAKDAVLREFADRGHDADLSAIDWAEFFTRRRVPRPQRVVRLATDLTEARAAWAEITACEKDVAIEFPVPVSSTYEKLDELGKRGQILDRLLDRTARLAVRDQGQGRFVAEGKGVKSFVLWLEPAMLGKDGAVEVKWQNRAVRKKVAPSVSVLLREFAERFDRTFLPVAQVLVP
jgi:poly(3-hydroxybutyrate) depolymerase